jgi:hypothetical protein
MKSAFSQNQMFCLKDSILSAVFEEGGVVFDLDSRACHELNQTGAQILSLLDGRRRIDDVVSLLAEMLNASKETIKEDTEVFLKDLIGRGWVYVSQK